jgi:hypothetical protein
MDPAEPADQAPPESTPDSLVDSATRALRGALQVAEASLALLRAELRLARSSALSIVWLGFALVFFGVGAWLATSLGIALAIHAISGSLLLGVGTVAAGNLVGAAWVLHSMRRCWRDLSLPRTRALLVSSRPEDSATTAVTAQDTGPAASA